MTVNLFSFLFPSKNSSTVAEAILVSDFEKTNRPVARFKLDLEKSQDIKDFSNIDGALNVLISNNKMTPWLANMIRTDVYRVVYQYAMQKNYTEMDFEFEYRPSGLFVMVVLNNPINNSSDGFTLLFVENPGDGEQEKVKNVSLEKYTSQLSSEELRGNIEIILRSAEESLPTESETQEFMMRIIKHFYTWFDKNLKSKGKQTPAGGVAKEFSKNEIEVSLEPGNDDYSAYPATFKLSYFPDGIKTTEPLVTAFFTYTIVGEEIYFRTRIRGNRIEDGVSKIYLLKRDRDPLVMKTFSGFRGAGEIVNNSIRTGLNFIRQDLQNKFLDKKREQERLEKSKNNPELGLDDIIF
jgi:hypothetical protein